jgi:hypothetical protein
MSVYKNLPFLPGHRFNDPYKQSYNKNQILHLKTNTCLGKIHNINLEKSNINEQIDPFSISGLSTLTSAVTSERLKHRDTPFNQSYPRILPQWIKFDKNVLKFTGYFVEHVVESAYENYRIRKCNLLYYLEDDSIHVTEVKEENSGIPQGYFIKRHKAEKSDQPGEYIKWQDIDLCSEITLYGKKFRICECDEFTSKFYADKGVKLKAPEPVPEVDFEDKFKNIDIKTNLKNISDLKEYNEVFLGGGHPNKTLKQFLENDRKVLNFDIVWFDDKYDKEEKHYKMNYYLADGMVSSKTL